MSLPPWSLQLLATCYFCLLTVKRNVPLLNQWRGKVYNQSTNRLLFAPFPLAFCEAINNDCLNLRLVNIFLPNLIPFFNSRDGSGGDGIDSTICVKMPGTRWSNEMEQWNGTNQYNNKYEKLFFLFILKWTLREDKSTKQFYFTQSSLNAWKQIQS